MKRALQTAGCLALVLAVAGPTPAAPGEAGETRVADLGTVDLYRDGVSLAGTPRQAEVEEEFEASGRVTTRDREHAVVVIGEQDRIDLDENTSVAFHRQKSQQDVRPITEAEITGGGVWAFASRLLPHGLNIYTHARETKVGVKRTVLEVRVLDDRTTLIRVHDGESIVEGGGSGRRVPAGTQTLVRRGDKPLLPRSTSPFDPPLLLLSPEAGLEDPRLLDFVDPRVEPPKGEFP